MPGRVLLDLNSPGFLDDFLDLDRAELARVSKALKRIRSVDWETLLHHPGFRWEQVQHIRAPNGATSHSLRLSQKYRALAYRDGDYLRIVSLHLDHDSAYDG